MSQLNLCLSMVKVRLNVKWINMKQLSNVSIFDIKCCKDRVLNIETNQVGTLDVKSSTYGDYLDLYVKWDGSNEYMPLNQHDKDLFLINAQV
jgi:hypothetical protein